MHESPIANIQNNKLTIVRSSAVTIGYIKCHSFSRGFGVVKLSSRYLRHGLGQIAFLSEFALWLEATVYRCFAECFGMFGYYIKL